ncbi:MAG: biotin--[acetyl-CoA-carboxylase] ligase [Bacteroidales bacterium]|nr:biotin--[acetyl-CoA-carboxylase] ligase [Bacteroidales bacterium]
MSPLYDIIWYDSLPSTNDEAWKALDGLDNLSVLAAREQTAGRGQGDHKWHSRAGENLTFTIVLKWEPEPFPASREKEISDAAAGAVVAYLASKGVTARIKYPNDIYVGDKKICGLLIKHRLRGTGLTATIVGVGLNLNEKDFPSDLPNPTSLALETAAPESFDPRAELKVLLAYFNLSR